MDRLDDVYFPRHGELFTLQWNGPRETLGADADSDRVSAEASLARSFGRNTVVLSAAGGANVSGSADNVQDFYTLGGLFNLSGLSPDAVSGPHYAIARAVYYRRIGSGQEGLFDVPTYLGFSLELGNVWERRDDISVSTARFNGSAFLGFDSDSCGGGARDAPPLVRVRAAGRVPGARRAQRAGPHFGNFQQ